MKPKKIFSTLATQIMKTPTLFSLLLGISTSLCLGEIKTEAPTMNDGANKKTTATEVIRLEKAPYEVIKLILNPGNEMILGKKDKTKEKSLIIIGGNKIPVIGEIILVTGNEKKIVAFPKAPSTITCEKWERPEIAKNETIPERIPERIPEKVAKPSSTSPAPPTPPAPATNSPKTKSPSINQIFEN